MRFKVFHTHRISLFEFLFSFSLLNIKFILIGSVKLLFSFFSSFCSFLSNLYQKFWFLNWFICRTYSWLFEWSFLTCLQFFLFWSWNVFIISFEVKVYSCLFFKCTFQINQPLIPQTLLFSNFCNFIVQFIFLFIDSINNFICVISVVRLFFELIFFTGTINGLLIF